MSSLRIASISSPFFTPFLTFFASFASSQVYTAMSNLSGHMKSSEFFAWYSSRPDVSRTALDQTLLSVNSNRRIPSWYSSIRSLKSSCFSSSLSSSYARSFSSTICCINDFKIISAGRFNPLFFWLFA